MLTQATILAAEEHAENDIILPHDLNEVIWGTIAFLIIVFALWKFAWEPLKKAMADKRERIAGELTDAEAARTAAQARLEEVRSQLSGADAERSRLIAEARSTATAIGQEYDERAIAEAAALRERAQRDMAASQQQAMADLQSMVGDLALGAAELVVRNNLDDSTQDDLIERYIAQMANN